MISFWFVVGVSSCIAIWVEHLNVMKDPLSSHITGYNAGEFYIIGGKNISLNLYRQWYTIGIELTHTHPLSDYFGISIDGQGYTQYNNKIYYVPAINNINRFSIYEFDILTEHTDTITSVPSIHFGIGYHAPCVTINDDDVNNILIYVIGSPRKTNLNIKVSQYNMNQNIWTGFDNLIYPRSLASCNYYNGNLYVIGGYIDCSSILCGYFNTIHKHNGSIFADIDSVLDKGIHSHRSVLVPSTEQIYIIGGYNEDKMYSNRVYILNTTNDDISYGPNLNVGRSQHSSFHVNGVIYVFGGTTDTNFAINSVETLDITTAQLPAPTLSPLTNPQKIPTNSPLTTEPTMNPTQSPIITPILTPTNIPSMLPTQAPLPILSYNVTNKTESPTLSPSITSTLSPSEYPTNIPTTNPTNINSSPQTSATISSNPNNSSTIAKLSVFIILIGIGCITSCFCIILAFICLQKTVLLKYNPDSSINPNNNKKPPTTVLPIHHVSSNSSQMTYSINASHKHPSIKSSNPPLPPKIPEVTAGFHMDNYTAYNDDNDDDTDTITHGNVGKIKTGETSVSL